MSTSIVFPAIHPFPARMAPELASKALRGLKHGARVLDPMMGSGTFPLAAGRAGHLAVGIDTDPLALLIARTSRCLWDTDAVLRAGRHLVKAAETRIVESWEHPDAETNQFIDYWFDPLAKRRLGTLAQLISSMPSSIQDPLWVAFSRLIITKDAGASKARDVSHSRPHRVRKEASFDPRDRYTRTLETVLSRALANGPATRGGRVDILRSDARAIPLRNESIDLIMTSPPYLTAIDYLRGHRMSLVWMGHTILELRLLRGTNIGSERSAPPLERYAILDDRVRQGHLSTRSQGILNRFIGDLDALLREVARVLKDGATAVLVVADATVQGQIVNIAGITQVIGESNGLRLNGTEVRDLPSGSRYLPMPATSSTNSLARRMRLETILTLRRE